MNKLAPAFIKAKKAFSPALKDKTNPAFRSKYADLGACLEAVNDALLENGIAVYQETRDDASGVTVETVFLHESGESMRCGPLHVPASKQDPQGYGSALTYARRYSLMAACGIAPEDDDGNAASEPKRKANGILEGVGVHKPTDGAWEALDNDQQMHCQLLASLIPGIWTKDGIEEVVNRLEREDLDNDMKIGLWTLLDSKVRAAIKREQEKRRLGGKAQQAAVYQTAESPH